jgi:hypothetical protein
MFYEWLIVYYFKERGSGLFYDIITAFCWRDLAKLRKTLVRVISLQIENESPEC